MKTVELIRGIDVGGTSIKAIVADASGTVYGEWNALTPRGGDAEVEAIADLVKRIDEALQAREVTGAPGVTRALPDSYSLLPAVCVDLPGIVDDEAGLGVLGVNLGWENYPFAHKLTEALGMPAYVTRDARAGAYGEARFGAAPPTCIYLPIGTGVGSTILMNNAVITPDLWAGEVGQLPMPDPDHPGTLIALEKICSARAYAERFHALKPNFLPADAGAYEVFRLRDTEGEGSQEAHYVIETGLASLADAIAAWTALTGPIPVVIGGGLGKEGQPLVDELSSLLQSRCLKTPPILTASLGSLSQALGTVAIALDKTAQ